MQFEHDGKTYSLAEIELLARGVISHGNTEPDPIWTEAEWDDYHRKINGITISKAKIVSWAALQMIISLKKAAVVSTPASP